MYDPMSPMFQGYCTQLANMGLCNHPIAGSTVKAACPVTCGVCETPEPVCRDNYEAALEFFKGVIEAGFIPDQCSRWDCEIYEQRRTDFRPEMMESWTGCGDLKGLCNDPRYFWQVSDRCSVTCGMHHASTPCGVGGDYTTCRPLWVQETCELRDGEWRPCKLGWTCSLETF